MAFCLRQSKDVDKVRLTGLRALVAVVVVISNPVAQDTLKMSASCGRCGGKSGLILKVDRKTVRTKPDGAHCMVR